MEKRNGRRVILFPLPLQGCINPMLQLARILFSKGFSITVIHTRLHAPKAEKFPLFTFLQIPDGLSETQVNESSSWNVMSLLVLINRNCEFPFRESIGRLLKSEESEKISCLIDDCGWLFTKSVSDSFGLPRIVLSTFAATFLNAYPILPTLRRKGYLSLQDSEADEHVKEFPPLRNKDLPRILSADDELELDTFTAVVVETTKTSSGLIYMSCEELEQDSLSRSMELFRVPIFPIGPFHAYFPASSSSLFAQDETCIPWLDNHEDKSVIYVSLGSVVTISESEFLEIAWGLRDCNRPFLWVVRPGSVRGAHWIEPLSKGLVENLEEKGKIVKWAPQQEILAHRAIGGFLTHNGLNSTLESICEGVPMICLPGGWDQMLNARAVSHVWRVGQHLEGRVERKGIESTIRRLMNEPQGRELRDRTKELKDRVKRSIEQGGSSFRYLQNLVDHILSL